MTHITLKPSEVKQLTETGTLLIQNLDSYEQLSLSKQNVTGKWFEVDARSFTKIAGPLYLRNDSTKSALEIVYEVI